MNTEIATPRTDAAIDSLQECDLYQHLALEPLARQLERELAHERLLSAAFEAKDAIQEARIKELEYMLKGAFFEKIGH